MAKTITQWKIQIHIKCDAAHSNEKTNKPHKKRSEIMKTAIVGLAFMLINSLSLGAEFTILDQPNFLEISGPITDGDYKKFAKFVLSNDAATGAFIHGVSLNSPGGNVIESIKIAQIIDKSYSNILLRENATCASSCFILFAAGTSRIIFPNSRLGVHRMSLNDGSISIGKTEKIINPLSTSLDSYLEKLGIPRSIMDKMHETSSGDIFWITSNWLSDQGLYNTIQYKPVFIDIASKKCGRDPLAYAYNNNVPIAGSLKAESRKWLDCIGRVQDYNQMQNIKEVGEILGKAAN